LESIHLRITLIEVQKKNIIDEQNKKVGIKVIRVELGKETLIGVRKENEVSFS
jgi:hypothetical protein